MNFSLSKYDFSCTYSIFALEIFPDGHRPPLTAY